jgi:hypothetical protein
MDHKSMTSGQLNNTATSFSRMKYGDSSYQKRLGVKFNFFYFRDDDGSSSLISKKLPLN